MEPKRRKRDIIIPFIFGVIFLVSLSVMFYPTFSNWWNKRHQARAVASYKRSVAQIDNSETERMLREAHDYNEKLAGLYAPFTNFKQIAGYDDILDISGTGIMGYVSVPSINVELPIYHGTSEGVLQIASGHIQGSSFPVGGVSTHAVISGHRGLPSARLFTDLDRIVDGDTFTINVLNEVLTYEVESIMVILPDDTDKLAIIPGEDEVTLMTCTPYGVNSHRLLIRGHRIETFYDRKIKVAADALQVDSMTVIPVVFVPLLMMLLVYWHISGKRRKKIRIDKYTVRKLIKRD
ncbi:class C sortase [Ruminococcus flavefaciens]|uniref:class C sortase n=1 Tax=Ruminococcus flavefaciens TaxID=1265 RepID=UPI0002F205E3|nr:class C sortase [Ruminococcus flavefaciens]